MKKQLQKFLPLIVGLIVLVLLVSVRAWRLSIMPADGRWPNVAGGTYSTPVMKNGVNYFVPPDELYDNGMGKDGIPALNAPVYVSVATADEVLDDTVEGLDVEVDGQHRFYSFQILSWHQIVNDKFGNRELLVSYSPLCGSAVVYDRVVEDGVTRNFGDNGQVYNNCPVFYDSTTTNLWDQASGALVAGHDHATSLTRYSSVVMTWDAWKKANPNGEALSTETGFVRDYRRHPYGNYEKNTSLFFPVNKTDTRLGSKDVVQDFQFGETHVGATAKFLSFVKEPNYFSAEAGFGQADYVAFVSEHNQVHLFNRTIGDRTLTFIKENGETKDKETDSRWTPEGLCIKGKLKGKQLAEIFPSARYFAFAYVSHFPTAKLLGDEMFDQANIPAPTPAPTEINVGF
ncbi:MAG: DUF3179 domain-containing (seleno)protein [Patescibacteria group bacterium]|jgi:hypothetical protein